MSIRSNCRHAQGRGLALLIIVATTAAAAVVLPLAGAHAETVFDAMRDAFALNPAIAAERERLKATDQSIPAAEAGFLPTISASASAGLQQATYAIAPDQTVRQKPYSFSATLEQPLFDGGAALAAVRRATASVRAGRQLLLSTEAGVLLAAATAFADVQRSRAVVTLENDRVTALAAILAETRERRGVGDATVADLAQSQSAHAGAELQRSAARAALADAEAQFLEIVRRAPGRTEPLRPARLPLPGTLDEAFRRADAEHPSIVAARNREVAARHAVEVAAAKYLPTVSLQAGYQGRREVDGYISASTPETTASVEAVARFPLYSGGSVDAETRAARHTQMSLVHEIERQRAAVRTGVSSAWTALQQNEKALLLLARQVEAGSAALGALRKEQAVGERTLTDVLAAERDLVQARVSLAQGRRDAIVTRFALLASIGELTIATITTSAPRPPAPPKSAPRAAAQWATTVVTTRTRVAGQP